MEKSLKDKTAHGLFWGGISTTLQQVLNLLFGIFLARILNAEDYGMVGMLTIFTLIAGTLQESGFTAALVNKKEVTHADYNAVFWAGLFIGCGMYLILFLCAPLIADFYGKPELIPLSRFLFIGFVITSTGTVHNAILFKNMKVKQRTIAQLSALMVSGVFGVLMALNGMAYWGIAVQNVLYVLTMMSLYWYFSGWTPTMHIDFKPLKSFFRFSSLMLITQLFTHINNNVFTVILGRFFTTASVGFYTQAAKWNTMGNSIITGMVNGIAQPVFSSVSEEKERQRKIFRKLVRFTAFISFPCMFGLGLIAKEFILIAVTAKWEASIPILQMLCIWGAFVPITYLFTNLIISRGKSSIYMGNTIALGIMQVLLLLVTYPYGIDVMILSFVILNIFWLVVWAVFVNRQIELRLIHMAKDILPFAFIALSVMIIAYFLTQSLDNLWISMISKIGIAVVLYIGSLWLLNTNILKECIEYIKKKR